MMAATDPADDSPRRAAAPYGQPQPSRIKSFLMQNHNSPARKILIPLMYALVAALYFYGLLFRDVGSGVHVLRENIDKNITYASAPIWGASMGEEVQLAPRSLADVTIANAEVAWKRQLDHQKDARRRAEKMEAQRKMREEAIQLRIRQYNDTETEQSADGESHQPKVLRLSNSSLASNVSHSDAMQYLKGATNLRRSHQRRRVDNIKGDLGFLRS